MYAKRFDILHIQIDYDTVSFSVWRFCFVMIMIVHNICVHGSWKFHFSSASFECVIMHSRVSYSHIPRDLVLGSLWDVQGYQEEQFWRGTSENIAFGLAMKFNHCAFYPFDDTRPNLSQACYKLVSFQACYKSVNKLVTMLSIPHVATSLWPQACYNISFSRLVTSFWNRLRQACWDT